MFDRKRLVDLFDFDYQLEMYKPVAERRWGYYALPILYGDRLVGKLDAAADRAEGALVVTAVHEDEPFTAEVADAVTGRDRGSGPLARPGPGPGTMSRMAEPFDVSIRDESIRLGQFLKLANLVESGAEAKPVIADGAVLVNGEVETPPWSPAGQGRRGHPRAAVGSRRGRVVRRRPALVAQPS